jgi:hypothetical protein
VETSRLSSAFAEPIVVSDLPVSATHSVATSATSPVGLPAHHTVSTSIDSSVIGVERQEDVDTADVATSPLAAARAPVPSSVSATHPSASQTPEDAWEVKDTDVEVFERIGGGSYGDIFRGKMWGTDVAVKLIVAAVVTEEVCVCLWCVCGPRLPTPVLHDGLAAGLCCRRLPRCCQVSKGKSPFWRSYAIPTLCCTLVRAHAHPTCSLSRNGVSVVA